MEPQPIRILVISTNPGWQREVASYLTAYGYQVEGTDDPEGGRTRLASGEFDGGILDLRAGRGRALLARCTQWRGGGPGLVIISEERAPGGLFAPDDAVPTAWVELPASLSELRFALSRLSLQPAFAEVLV